MRVTNLLAFIVGIAAHVQDEVVIAAATETPRCGGVARRSATCPPATALLNYFLLQAEQRGFAVAYE